MLVKSDLIELEGEDFVGRLRVAVDATVADDPGMKGLVDTIGPHPEEMGELPFLWQGGDREDSLPDKGARDAVEKTAQARQFRETVLRPILDGWGFRIH